MWDWFLKDPAGWISVVIVVVGTVLSAVFWKRMWSWLKAVGRVLRSVTRWASSLRVVTSDRLPARGPVVPVRWDITRLKDSPKEEFVLINFGTGSIARDVRLDSLKHDAVIRSSAFWEAIDGGGTGKFILVYDMMAFWMGVNFRVEWTDSRGERNEEIIFKRSE